MSGDFIPSALPDLPGAYTHFEAALSTQLPPSPGGIIAVPITHDWGPIAEPVLCSSFSEFERIFGTDDSPGRLAIYESFFGEGLAGAGGANAVYALRLANEEAAAAAASVTNPTPAAAIEVTARWKGTRGNRLKVVASAIVEEKQHVSILDGTVELESFSFGIKGATALAKLVATINARSPWVEATLTKEGETGLKAGTSNLEGGLDGATLTGEDWTNGVTALSGVDFAYLAPFDLPWATGEEAKPIKETILALQAFTNEQITAGHRFTLVVGGALGEEPTDAITRALELDDPAVITVGGPGVKDETFGELSTSQLAPRIAGIRAQRGESQNMHFARLKGTLPLLKGDGTAVSLSETEQMVAAGVVVLARDRYSLAPTRVVKDVNTWTPAVGSQAEEERPRKIFGNPKMVQTMQQFSNQAEALIERDLIGRVVVTDASRQAAAGRVLTLADGRIKTGAFQPGFKVTAEPGTEDDDFIKLAITMPFGRSLTQLFLNATVS